MNRYLSAFVSVTLLFGHMASCPAADIVWVHQLRGQEDEGTGTIPNAGEGTLAWEDDQWRALLEGAGHTIVAHDRFDDFELDDSSLAVLNDADLVIFSRDTNSGDYNDPVEQETWTEGITVPMIVLSPFVLRTSRWQMVDSEGIIDTDKANGIGPLSPLDPTHPIFAGALDANNEADIWDEDVLGPDDSIDFIDAFNDDGKVGNGTLLAIETSLELPWIIYWEEGAEFYDGSAFTAGGPRLYYSVGSDDDPFSWGEKNTTAAGDKILLNAIDWLTGSSGLTGDFNSNGALDAGDLDLLAQGQRDNNVAYDLNSDGATNLADRTLWVEQLKQTWMGDSDLNGQFNSGDFVAVFQAGKFETGQAATWSEGDWNGDMRFDSSDFVLAFQSGGYERGPRVPPVAVPEPCSLVLFLAASVLLAHGRCRT
jgi:hypothetical protein